MKRILAFFLLLFPAPAFADGYGFMMPSGNVYCNGSVEFTAIGCNIIEFSGPHPQPQPASCNQSWGHSFYMEGRGEVVMECREVPQRVNYTDVAPYGVSASFGDITCISESTGLTCRNLDGHGFRLSRGTREIF